MPGCSETYVQLFTRLHRFMRCWALLVCESECVFTLRGLMRAHVRGADGIVSGALVTRACPFVGKPTATRNEQLCPVLWFGILRNSLAILAFSRGDPRESLDFPPEICARNNVLSLCETFVSVDTRGHTSRPSKWSH